MDLAITKQNRLATQEAIIDEGKDTFLRVGNALLIIRNEKLYAPEYASFKAYCERRHGFTRKTAYEYMQAATVLTTLTLESDTHISIDALQELGKIADPVERTTVYQLSKMIQEKTTAPIVRAAQTVVEDMKLVGAVDTGNGKMTLPIPETATSAVIQNLSDAKQRQLDHIRGNYPRSVELVKETMTLQQACDLLAELAVTKGSDVTIKLVVYELQQNKQVES